VEDKDGGYGQGCGRGWDGLFGGGLGHGG
jgi:hypothetical protein